MSSKGHRKHGKSHSLLGRIVKVLWFSIRLVYGAAVLAAEGFFWGVHGARKLVGVGKQVHRAMQVARTGTLTCPDGHEVPVNDGTTVHQCSSCGFRYRGSPLVCPNEECETPIASFATCPTCSLSVSPGLRSH